MGSSAKKKNTQHQKSVNNTNFSFFLGQIKVTMSLTTADLKKRIADILKDADLETTSAKKVRTQLEEDTGSDLSSRKEEIGRIIQEVMDETQDSEEEDEDEEEEEESEEDYSPKKNGSAKAKAKPK